MTRRTTSAPYDAIVIGGGHNGLVTAALLGQGGLRTLVLEAREHVGGAVETAELAPGVRVPALAQTVGRLRPSVARQLELRRHGLSLVAPAVRTFAPHPDGSAITLWADPGRTAAELRARSARDAAAWPEFDAQVRRAGRVLAELAAMTPPDLAGPSLPDAAAAVRLLRSYRGLGKREAGALLQLLPMAVADLASDTFELDHLRALVVARGVQSTAMGPRSAGTVRMLLADSAGNDGGAAGQTVFARGGPGALSDALASAARAAGVEIRTGARVVRILSSDEAVKGVALASGEEIAAAVVVSGVDPRQTLLQLVDPVALGPRLRWRAGNIRAQGRVAKVNFALAELPRFAAAQTMTDREQRLRGRIVIAPSVESLDRADDAATFGRLPEVPMLEATIPSLIDPGLIEDGAREGGPGRPPIRHVMSVLVHQAPYALRDGDWDARRDELGDLVARTIEPYAPGFEGLVMARQVITPLDLERTWGLTGGHPDHAEAGLDQWFAWRPLLGSARYRLPLTGLYLCGAGAHPGGGVTGGPGENAAREILADRRRRR